MLFFFRRVVCLAVCLALAASLSFARQEQPPQTETQTMGRISVKVALVDKGLSVKPVPKFALVVERALPDDATARAGGAMEAATSFDGAASFQLPAGEYVVRSAKPVEFEGKAYEWAVKVKVEEGREAIAELSNDNAKVTELPSAPAASPAKGTRRRVTEEAEMFQRLRDGVVTVEGELGHGTGFIVDDRGLILTNQHVVSTSKEVRIQFDRKHKVRALVLAEDAERDVAVLWANLSACASCRTLPIAKGTDEEPSIIEGEKVFAIGSPLSQEKILTSGIASKVEKRAIISDVNINPGNSGGPLFNSVGEVVGITTFAEQAQTGGPGVSGIVRIEEAAALLAKAGDATKDKERPSSELMPTDPDDAFPVDAIKARLDVKKFETKHYKAEVGDYDVMMLTPVHKFYLTEKDRLEAARERDKRNKDAGAQGTVDKYRNLRNWTEYAGQLKPVVEILALPEMKATGKSLFLSAVMMGATGAMLPMDYKFKADFYEMTLTCDGKPVTPIRRAKSEIVVPMPSYFKVKNRYTYAGIYTYPLDAFDPARCQQLALDIFSEETPTRPERKILSPQMRARVWDDFDEYRKKQQQQPADKPTEKAAAN